jgi:hypothetical protein
VVPLFLHRTCIQLRRIWDNLCLLSGVLFRDLVEVVVVCLSLLPSFKVVDLLDGVVEVVALETKWAAKCPVEWAAECKPDLQSPVDYREGCTANGRFRWWW